MSVFIVEDDRGYVRTAAQVIEVLPPRERGVCRQKLGRHNRRPAVIRMRQSS